MATVAGVSSLGVKMQARALAVRGPTQLQQRRVQQPKHLPANLRTETMLRNVQPNGTE